MLPRKSSGTVTQLDPRLLQTSVDGEDGKLDKF